VGGNQNRRTGPRKPFFSFFFNFGTEINFLIKQSDRHRSIDVQGKRVLDQGCKCFALIAGYSKAADGQPGRHSKHSQATSERLFCIITLPNGC
jgi:hypothetical protein